MLNEAGMLALANDICSEASKQDVAADPTLITGHAGRALALAVIGTCVGNKSFIQRACEHLDEALTLLREQDLSPSLYHGFTGVVLVVEQLESRGLLPEMCDLREIDEVLRDYVESRSTPTSHDVVQGLVGIGVYQLERSYRTRDRVPLVALVAALKRAATTTEKGTAWNATTLSMRGLVPPEAKPDAIADLGLAHGSAGVIAFLSRVLRASPECSDARELMTSSTSYLLSQLAGPVPGAHFPHAVVYGAAANHIQRVAWCYGDLGIGYALAQAGLCGLMQASRVAEDSILALADIVPEALSCDADDATYCHGAAGRAHVLHSLTQMMRSPNIEASAFSHLDHAVELLFAQSSGANSIVNPLQSASLLNGPLGVALVLATWNVERMSWWSRFLLVGQ